MYDSLNKRPLSMSTVRPCTHIQPREKIDRDNGSEGHRRSRRLWVSSPRFPYCTPFSLSTVEMLSELDGMVHDPARRAGIKVEGVHESA